MSRNNGLVGSMDIWSRRSWLVPALAFAAGMVLSAYMGWSFDGARDGLKIPHSKLCPKLPADAPPPPPGFIVVCPSGSNL